MLTEGEAIRITGIPNFVPEILQRARITGPMKCLRSHRVPAQPICCKLFAASSQFDRCAAAHFLAVNSGIYD
jgi:hypothetical protein